MTVADPLDYFMPPHIRLEIERRYLEPINKSALLENAILDPAFLADPAAPVPFFADHGVVHARDIAGQVLRVLDVAHGLLIPFRSPDRLQFMRGLGVVLAFLHDIGTLDHSAAGRAMHAEWAAQAVLSPEFDDIAAALWDENSGNLAWRLAQLAGRGRLSAPAPLILRELLAVVSCHSKTKVPTALFAEPVALRRMIQEQVSTDLPVRYTRQRVGAARDRLRAANEAGQPARIDASRRALDAGVAELTQAVADAGPRESHLRANLRRLYDNFEHDAFAWLVSPDDANLALVADVTDTLRALRCADALRQRGTTLRTAGGYEIYIDRRTAHAVYSLRLGSDHLYLLEMSNPISAGEANIAASELTPEGDLLVAFHRGSFASAETSGLAARNAALVVNDIQADAIQSFQRPPGLAGGSKPAERIAILLEGVDDNPEFAGAVLEELALLNPRAATDARCVPSWRSMTDYELRRYQEASPVDWDAARQSEVLARIAAHGHKITGIDPARAFASARLVHLQPGNVLVRAGDPAGFVYIPMGSGLAIDPLGGYASFSVGAWMPVGITGIIRGAARNATITAQTPVTLLMIPREVYLSEWHRTYAPEELRDLLCRNCDR